MSQGHRPAVAGEVRAAAGLLTTTKAAPLLAPPPAGGTTGADGKANKEMQ
ncbi:hypothetical protein [Streptomyces sp. NPDC005283]